MEGDPEVRRYVGGKARLRENAESRFRELFLPPAKGRLALWATVYKPDGAYIGYCGVCGHRDQAGNSVEGEGKLAHYLARLYWGRGLATEAGRALADWGSRELSLRRITAGVEVGHAASIRVLEKLGFHQIGENLGPVRSFYEYASLPTQAHRGT